MTKKRIRDAAAGEPPEGTWSNCLVVDKHVYIAGMTSRSDEFNTIVGDNAYEQSKVIFDKIKALIEAAGGLLTRGPVHALRHSGGYANIAASRLRCCFNQAFPVFF